ncbi:MAG TPA: hypothetical protein VHZ96_01875 [Frankiaceae bacterium]|nr:hypothetical protein [Frankiaceae bacterium]
MTTNTSPKIEGVEATFRNVADIEWTEVQRQRNADGTVSVVREKWPIFRPDFLSAYVHYEPGMVVRRHGHRSNHIVFVLDGGAWIGGVWSGAGMHVHVPLGASFGPIVAGPEGVTCWELSFGEFGGWGDQPELYAREIEARGITPLPDPPLKLADWFVDPRGDVGTERPTPKIEGLAETLKAMDDIEWTEVKRQRNADGAIAVVREKWPIADPDFMSAYIEYLPGMITRRHGHFGHHLVFVIAGGAWFGDRWCPAGTHIELPFGAAFGPIRAGEEGTFFLELTNGDFRSWGDQPELYEQAIATHGVTPLPDPEIQLGEWFEDARGYWAPKDEAAAAD